MTEENLLNEDGQEFGKGRRTVAYCDACGYQDDDSSKVGTKCPKCGATLRAKSVLD